MVNVNNDFNNTNIGEIGFNPVISSIECSIISTQELEFIATVKDDGPIENLIYQWSFDKIVSENEIEETCGGYSQIQTIYNACRNN